MCQCSKAADRKKNTLKTCTDSSAWVMLQFSCSACLCDASSFGFVKAYCVVFISVHNTNFQHFPKALQNTTTSWSLETRGPVFPVSRRRRFHLRNGTGKIGGKVPSQTVLAANLIRLPPSQVPVSLQLWSPAREGLWKSLQSPPPWPGRGLAKPLQERVERRTGESWRRSGAISTRGRACVSSSPWGRSCGGINKQ